jgi:DNA-binding transcriptional ArsR family regulator
MRDAYTFDVVDDIWRAATLLHPMRLRILHALKEEPDSATGLARRFRLPRQTVNYHVRALARARLLRRAAKRRKGNMVEHRYVASAQAYVLAQELMGPLAADANAAAMGDTFSAGYLVALGARLQSEVVRAMRDAEQQGKRLATFSLSSDLQFTSAEQRARFAEALRAAVVEVMKEFVSPPAPPDGAAPAGRRYRFVLGCYPAPPDEEVS